MTPEYTKVSFDAVANAAGDVSFAEQIEQIVGIPEVECVVDCVGSAAALGSSM